MAGNKETLQLAPSKRLGDAETIYRNEAYHPLLTKEEEILLGETISLGLRATETISENDHGSKERAKLEQQVKAGTAARNRLVRYNLRLVIKLARRYSGGRVSFLDLVQEGNLGLIRAAEKFDSNQGHRFSTYATWWIRQKITVVINRQGRVVEWSERMANLQQRLHRATQKLTQELHKNPSPEMVAERLRISLKKLDFCWEVARRRPTSLQGSIGNDGTEFSDLIGNAAAILPEEITTCSLLKEKVREVFAELLKRGVLSEREAGVLAYRSGLYGGPGLTFEEIGKKYQLTRQRIQQIQKEATKKIEESNQFRELCSLNASYPV